VGLWGGLGFALAVIYLVGFISRTAAGSLLSVVDEVLAKVPGLGTIYGYLRDLMQAISGEDARFKTPVWVHPYPRSKMKMIGFITREDLRSLGLRGEVAVFLPLAYNISGTLVILPRSQVTPVNTRSKDLLAFVATAGLTGAHEPGKGHEHGKPGKGHEHSKLGK
ncbi:MAG TPA: DUF502 domain-containing protein, partial [bacterium]|nr:DUF502 domain-containing protein [bacterium]